MSTKQARADAPTDDDDLDEIATRRELPRNAANADDAASHHTGRRSHLASTDQELNLLQRFIREELTRALEHEPGEQ